MFSRHEAFMARRPASARGRFYCASVDAGMCEAAFNAAVIRWLPPSIFNSTAI